MKIFLTNAKKVTKINSPSTLAEIGSRSVKYCESLTKVIIPPSATMIGDSAFWRCLSLTKMGSTAFEDCYKLEKITLNGWLNIKINI